MPKTERDAFTLRLKPEILSFVKQAAEEKNRSVPNFVETVLLNEKRRREAHSREPDTRARARQDHSQIPALGGTPLRRHARCGAAPARARALLVHGLGPGSRNIWTDFGSCPLAFAEYLLIGVAGLLFPGELLNDEGVNRGASMADAEGE